MASRSKTSGGGIFPSTEATAAAFLSTFLISLAPNVILFLSPNYGQSATAAKRQNAVLSIGQALAAGGLLGDVFLHTLPHAMADEHSHSSHDGGHHHGHGSGGLSIGMMVLIGFSTFLVFDILVRSVGGDVHHHHAGHCHDHSENEHSTSSGNDAAATAAAKGGAKAMISEKKPLLTPRSIFNSTVLLNLAADSLHNFTDGLAIGASFAASSITHEQSVASLMKSRGGMASLSVLMHELPHELGDFSILVSNGMSKRQAIMAQFSTAIAAFLGTFVGLAASSFDDTLGHEVLLPFTAGGFVYLAAVSILPELLEERNVGFALRTSQVLAFGLGVAFMQLVAIMEEMEGGHGHGHDHGYGQEHQHHHHHHEESHEHSHGHDHHDHGEL